MIINLFLIGIPIVIIVTSIVTVANIEIYLSWHSGTSTNNVYSKGKHLYGPLCIWMRVIGTIEKIEKLFTAHRNGT